MASETLLLSDADMYAIRALLGAAEMGMPMPADFVVPQRLVDKGLITIDDDGQAHVTVDFQWDLLRAGMYPTRRLV